MDITDAVTTEYAEHDVKTPLSKLRGTFDQRDARVVVITNGGSFSGIVARKQLMSSHHQPNETAGNIAMDPPKVQRTEDVREVARLMVENQLKLLPVFDGEQFVGAVTAERVLEMVRENLDVLDVEDVYTRDLIAVEPDTRLAEVIHLLREHRITRLPVIDDDGSPAGLISVYDMVDFVVRQMDREQGGFPDGFAGHGGSGSSTGYRSHGGFGDRAGEQAKLIDLPARDVMSTPVQTAEVGDPLGDAVERMLAENHSSLVVVEPGNPPEVIGIVTKTDALQALTWTEEDHIPVQIFNVELLDTLGRDEIAEKVEAIDAKYEDMAIQEVNVVFHEHEEQLRGMPLVMATIRLFTNRGRFFGSAEEYGAERAFEAASDVLEENVLQEKGRALDSHTRKNTPEKQEEISRLLGWWVEEV